MTQPNQVMHVHGGIDEAVDIHNIDTEQIDEHTVNHLLKEPWFMITNEDTDTYTCCTQNGDEFTLNKTGYEKLRTEYEYATEYQLTESEATELLLQVGKDLVADLGRTGSAAATVNHTQEHIGKSFAALLVVTHEA